MERKNNEEYNLQENIIQDCDALFNFLYFSSLDGDNIIINKSLFYFIRILLYYLFTQILLIVYQYTAHRRIVPNFLANSAFKE